MISIQERSFARIALFDDHHVDAHELRLVRQKIDKAGMRNLDKRLVIFAPHVRFLFPERIFADTECPDPPFDQIIDDATACRVQIGSNPAIALRRNAIKLAGSEPLRFCEVPLMAGTLLVVVLIQALKGTAIDQKRLESLLRTRHGCQGIDPLEHRSSNQAAAGSSV